MVGKELKGEELARPGRKDVGGRSITGNMRKEREGAIHRRDRIILDAKRKRRSKGRKAGGSSAASQNSLGERKG